MLTFCLNPMVIASIFAARLVLSTLYLIASYFCSRSQSLFLIKLCNFIRACTFGLDNLILLGLLLNYGASTVSTLVHTAESNWLFTFGSFSLLCLAVCCVSPFLADKAKLTRLFTVNLCAFVVIALFWAYLPPQYVIPVCHYVSRFGVVGGFFVVLGCAYALKFNSDAWVPWLLPMRRLTENLAFVDSWLGEPSDAQLLRNYAVLNLIQLNFVNLVLADQEQFSFVALSLTGLSAVPCLLLGFRNWDRMRDLEVPMFGFVQILWLSNKNTFKLLLEQYQHNYTPTLKSSAFVGVFLCGLGFASPVYCASTEIVPMDTSLSGEPVVPEDRGQGSPMAEGNTGSIRQSPYVRSQGSKMWDQVKDLPSTIWGQLLSFSIFSSVKAGYDAITGPDTPAVNNDAETENAGVFGAGQEANPSPAVRARHSDSTTHQDSSGVSSGAGPSTAAEQPRTHFAWRCVDQ